MSIVALSDHSVALACYTVSRDLPSDTQFDEVRWPNPSVLARKSCREIDHVPWKNLIIGKFREGSADARVLAQP